MGRAKPSPKCGAITLTFTFSPIRQCPVVSYLLTPQSRGQRLQFRRWAYALDLFMAASRDESIKYRGTWSSKRKGGAK